MLKRLFKRFSVDESARRADSIREWASAVPGATPIVNARPRTTVRIAGVVEGLRVRPREGVPAIEAVLTDGTGTVTATWLGRRTVPGLMLGCRLVLEGMLGGRPPDSLQLMNPSFDFVAPPSAGH